ncbi:ATP-binding protein [Paucibacter sp. R3-3]|uniref:histidine kinase n=1 Tax=Roseateles agri TaxID=3098619 RepID=A0ABU5DT71_9BURK|nr:ATP-binding protein [Paucibacter sp. R3-3]MDY0748604.1 ATP-binding protein [Paucibacter sp. R3-3]
MMVKTPAGWPRGRGEPDTPLTRWLRAVLWGALLVPAVAFVGAAWWGYREAEREAVAAAEHACELAWAQALRTFRIAAEIAQRTDGVSNMADADARAQQAQLHQRLADMTAGLPFVVNLNVWDADGTPIVRSDVYPVDPQASVGDRPYFQAQREAAMPLGISMVLNGRQTGREIVNATIRRSAPDGRFRGIVAVSMNPGYFRDYYQSLASEEPKLATFALVRTDGEVLARWPVAGIMRVPPGSPILAQIARGAASGSVVVAPSQGRETRLIAYRRLEGYPLYVTAGFSRSAMLAGWVRYVSLLAAIIGPTTAVLVYVSWLALRKTRREQATQRQLQEQMQLRAKVESAMMETQKLETLALVTGGVAHDFNNLLAIVNASLHVLKRRHPELGEEKQVKAMTRAIQTGVRLTRQLLSFSRKQALRPETVRLQQWLGTTESLIRTTLPANVSWQLHADADTAAVRVDLGELELALINLVVNACHAMPQGGALHVHAGNQDGMVALSVRDEGVGIAPELLARVTEPFFTTRDRGTGSGLGLSQVQGFCAQAGGSLQIESAVGEGTCVRMLLPASVVEPARAPDGAEAPPQEQQRVSGTVLLVEDNEDLATTSEMMLRGAGLEVLRAANADAALAVLNGGGPLPDVVLSDIAMPGSINGIGLAFALRQQLPELPVVLTTGYADQLSEAAEGGFRVLPKPTAPEALLAELRSVLLARRIARQAAAAKMVS